MQHKIPVQQLVEQAGPQINEMVTAIETCVHCGFCLPTCPTYQVLGEEMDSPRGRIFLMKSVLEGDLDLEESMPYIDRCLGCQACVTVCPSGVRYGELITPFRAFAETRRSHKPVERLQRKVIQETLPYPGRVRSAARLGKIGRPFAKALPREFSGMLAMLPERLPAAEPLPVLFAAEGKRRARVALLTGCVQQALAPEINWATLRVLAKNGVEVLLPPEQGCCGALAMHAGEQEQARQLAAKNLNAFPKGLDAILTNTAGCGSGMKEYGLLFKGTALEEDAAEFARNVQDVSEFLDELGLQPPPALPQPLVVAYHDACHLAHAQGITQAPRRLLMAIPNLTLKEIPEAELCCGSAGTYNLEHPEIAGALGKRKAANILVTSSQAVAMGNIGCMVQIRKALREANAGLPVYHTLQVLDMAYG